MRQICSVCLITFPIAVTLVPVAAVMTPIMHSSTDFATTPAVVRLIQGRAVAVAIPADATADAIKTGIRYGYPYFFVKFYKLQKITICAKQSNYIKVFQISVFRR